MQLLPTRIRDLVNGEKMRSPLRFQTSRPDIILVGDMERTLIPLDKEHKHALAGNALDGNIRMLQELNQRTLKILSTGSDIDRVKFFEDILKLMGFDLTFTDNGRKLYVNDSSYKPEEWLEELKKSECNTVWKRLMEEQVGWKGDTLVSNMIDFFKKLGFIEIDYHYKKTYPSNIFMGNKDGFEIAINPSTCYLAVFKNGKIQNLALKQFIITALEKIINQYLITTGNKLSYKLTDESFGYYSFFYTEPIEVNKLTSAEAIPGLFDPNLCSGVKAFIATGDRENDEHLKLRFVNVNGTDIPVFSLHSGDHLARKPGFSDHPRLFVSREEGDLAEELEKIIRCIDY